MKFNKIIKLLIVMLIVIFTMMFISQTVLAANSLGINPLKDDMTATFAQEDKSGASEAAGNIIGMIINIAQVIGTGVAIIMLVVVAIKYLAASPEGKAEYKKNAQLYVMGAIILFAASGILSIIRRFAVTSINKQSNLGTINNTTTTT